jgi:hypothetical protein
MSLASVSQASLTQATTRASNQSPEKAGQQQKKYLMMVDEEKPDFLLTPAIYRSPRPYFCDGAICSDDNTDDGAVTKTEARDQFYVEGTFFH